VSCVSADTGEKRQENAGVQPPESMNQSSKQLFFLDCFRNVSCVSADTGERRQENAENMIEALAASCTKYQQDYGKRVPELPEQQQDTIMPELTPQTQVAKALANMPDPRTAGVRPAESMNKSSKQLFFLDCFRNVSCVSADGGRSTAGVQPPEYVSCPECKRSISATGCHHCAGCDQVMHAFCGSAAPGSVEGFGAQRVCSDCQRKLINQSSEQLFFP
jgi:hypothetical protein